MKSIETLVEDIQKLFTEPHEPNPDYVREFSRGLAELVERRLREASQRSGPDSLRMSSIGKPDRQLYYSIRGTGGSDDREVLNASTLIKFLYGDIIECLMLYLAREAGHTVEREQEEVELNGVVGHIDAVIDGVVVDVKSASSPSFRKFRDGSLLDSDSFGYVDQLAGYSSALGGLDGAFLAVDKTLGHITLLEVPNDDLRAVGIPERIDHLRAVLSSDDTPDRCYESVEEGKSGNTVLSMECSYCPFKRHCWRDANGGIGLRTFLYASGPKHFVNVAKEPNVMEVTF